MFSKLKEGALAIVITALIVAAGYIAWDNYRDQKAEISQLKDKVAVKDDKINELEGNAVKDDTFKETTVVTDSKALEAIEQAKQQTTEAKRYVDKKLAEIDKKYSKLPNDEESTRAKSIEVSLERARGLWAVYCIQIPKDPACK